MFKRRCSFISPVSQRCLETSSGIHQKCRMYLSNSTWLQTKRRGYFNVSLNHHGSLTRCILFCKWEGLPARCCFLTVSGLAAQGKACLPYVLIQRQKHRSYRGQWWALLWATRSSFDIFMVLQKKAKKHIAFVVDADPIITDFRGKLKLLSSL